jgi:cytochrome P450
MYRAGNKFLKTDARGSTRDGDVTWDMVNETNEKKHGDMRRLVARAYAMDTMVNLEPMIDELISDLLGKLRELQGQRIDIGHWANLYAFGKLSTFSILLAPFGGPNLLANPLSDRSNAFSVP